MERITKNNKIIILGRNYLFDNEESLIGELEYISGISYFDELLNDKSEKEFRCSIHFLSKANGIEIKLAKLFNSYSVGVTDSEIENITIFDFNEPKLQIEQNGIKSIFRIKSLEKVISFLNKNYNNNLVLNQKERLNFLNKYNFLNDLELNIKSNRIGRRTFIAFWLFTGIFQFIIFHFVDDLLANIFWSIILTATLIIAGWQRYQDFGIDGINSLKLLIPIYNLYILFILIFNKGNSEKNQFGYPENETLKLFK